MTNYHCPTRFTPEQMKVLSANPFTYKVSAIYIHYTLEFKNLWLTMKPESPSRIFSLPLAMTLLS